MLYGFQWKRQQVHIQMFIQVKKNKTQQNIFINKGGQTSSASILKLGLVLQQEGSQVLNGVWWSGTQKESRSMMIIKLHTNHIHFSSGPDMPELVLTCPWRAPTSPATGWGPRSGPGMLWWAEPAGLPSASASSLHSPSHSPKSSKGQSKACWESVFT